VSSSHSAVYQPLFTKVKMFRSFMTHSIIPYLMLYRCNDAFTSVSVGLSVDSRLLAECRSGYRATAYKCAPQSL